MVRYCQTLLFCLIFLYGYANAAVLISDFAMTRMIELFSKRPYCKLYSDRGVIQRMFIKADSRKVRQVTHENMVALEEVCMKASGLSGELQGGLGFIYPGTKWCGPGNIASEYNELGRYAEEDKCCREHDLCPNILSPGECKRGLCNTQSFTRSHCDCDTKFRKCLQGLNTEIANTLGAVFFNVVQVTCFKERRPCSIHQSENCTYTYSPSGLYQLHEFNVDELSTLNPNEEDQLLASSTSQSIPRSINDDNDVDNIDDMYPVKQRSDNEVNSVNEVRIKSLALVAKSLYNDIVVRQFRGLYQLLKTATEVFNSNPS